MYFSTTDSVAKDVVKGGHVFDSVQGAVYLNQQTRGVDGKMHKNS